MMVIETEEMKNYDALARNVVSVKSGSCEFHEMFNLDNCRSTAKRFRDERSAKQNLQARV